jgi:hypothetical protein
MAGVKKSERNKEKFCKTCGKFMGLGSAVRTATCSKLCAGKAIAARAPKLFLCEVCGNEIKTRGKAVTCSKKCYHIRETTMVARAGRVIKTCVDCGETYAGKEGAEALHKNCSKIRGKEKLAKRIDKSRAKNCSIFCQICNHEFLEGMITSTHLLSKHNMKPEEYKEKFGPNSLYSKLRQKERHDLCMKINPRLEPEWVKSRTEGIEKMRVLYDESPPLCMWCGNKLSFERLVHLTGLTQEKHKCKKRFCCVECRASYFRSGKVHNPDLRNFSKEEKLMVALIRHYFPTLEVFENVRNVIQPLELDAYIPSINLALEYNGAWHYVPICGQEMLDRRIVTDARKVEKLKNLGINFYIADGRVVDRVVRYGLILEEVKRYSNKSEVNFYDLKEVLGVLTLRVEEEFKKGVQNVTMA